MKKSRPSILVLSVLCGATILGSSRAGVIVNGDFESGNTGFSSSYGYVAPGPNALYPAAVYTVDNNPQDSHGSFYNMGDHTTGSGNMMIVNGSLTTGIPVWEGVISINLTVGNEYDFSAWVASVYPASPAELTFSVDGVTIGTLSPTADGSWTRLFESFTATSQNPVFRLLNANDDWSGNDFAIDDIDVYERGTTVHPNSVPDGGPGLIGLAAVAGLVACHRRISKKRTA